MISSAQKQTTTILQCGMNLNRSISCSKGTLVGLHLLLHMKIIFSLARMIIQFANGISKEIVLACSVDTLTLLEVLLYTETFCTAHLVTIKSEAGYSMDNR